MYCYNEVNSPLPPASLRLVNTREGLPNTLACVSYESPSTTWTRQRDGLDAERYQRCLDETTSFHNPLAGYLTILDHHVRWQLATCRSPASQEYQVTLLSKCVLLQVLMSQLGGNAI